MPDLRAAALAFACLAAPASTLAVTGGTLDDAHSAVVLVASCVGATCGQCTGTVVDPSWVLSAAHCVPEGASAATPATFSIWTGKAPSLSPPPDAIADAYHVDPSWGGVGTEGHDLLLLHLTVPLVGITPAKVSLTALTVAEVGTPVTLVGDGATSSSDVSAPARRQVATSIASVMPPAGFTFGASGANACAGDGGAPLYTGTAGSEVVVGVVSEGSLDCLGPTLASDVGLDAAFLTATVPALAGTSHPRSGGGGCSSAGGGFSLLGVLAGLSMIRRRRGERE